MPKSNIHNIENVLKLKPIGQKIPSSQDDKKNHHKTNTYHNHLRNASYIFCQKQKVQV